MKYKPEDYSISDTGFYGFDDTEIENYKEKLVKCRKPHKCAGGCEKEIPIGEYAIRETGFMDGDPVASYTCIDCMDKWLDELNDLGDDEEDEQACRVCGCTWDNACEGGCYWVEDDLCSKCANERVSEDGSSKDER